MSAARTARTELRVLILFTVLALAQAMSPSPPSSSSSSSSGSSSSDSPSSPPASTPAPPAKMAASTSTRFCVCLLVASRKDVRTYALKFRISHFALSHQRVRAMQYAPNPFLRVAGVYDGFQHDVLITHVDGSACSNASLHDSVSRRCGTGQGAADNHGERGWHRASETCCGLPGHLG